MREFFAAIFGITISMSIAAIIWSILVSLGAPPIAIIVLIVAVFLFRAIDG
jgi:hypothetical protein